MTCSLPSTPTRSGGRPVSQFERPTGWMGYLIGQLMAHLPSNGRRNRWTVEQLKIQPHQDVLEIGHGPGLALEEVLRRLGTGMAVGIDHSATMRRLASRRLRKEITRGQLRLETGTLEDFPQWIDRVFAVNVAHFWEDLPAELAIIQRMLRPGGTVGLTVQPRWKGATAAYAERTGERILAAMAEVGLVAGRADYLELRPTPAVICLAERDSP